MEVPPSASDGTPLRRPFQKIVMPSGVSSNCGSVLSRRAATSTSRIGSEP
jgi:hypothetical protein